MTATTDPQVTTQEDVIEAALGALFPDVASSYGTSPTNGRRTKAHIADLEERIVAIVAEDHPMTVRGLFYRLVSAGAVAKTENEYKNVACRLALRLRRNGRLPYSWIADGTRWMRKPVSWSGLDDVLLNTARTYRRALWDNQPVYVEVWSEKDAIAGILHEATSVWDVPLMVARGFSSETFLWESAQAIRAIGKPTFLYHFGDHDPSGVAAATAIGRRLREFAPDIEIQFERVAVTEQQIADLDLPTRPTKRSDSRSKTWRGGSVEVDAIPPRALRDIATACIAAHVDDGAYERLRRVEAEERRVLEHLTREFTA